MVELQDYIGLTVAFTGMGMMLFFLLHLIGYALSTALSLFKGIIK